MVSAYNMLLPGNHHIRSNLYLGITIIFMRKFIFLFPILALFLASCSDADTVSRNLSIEADYFKVERRVIFYNGITGEYMLTIEWRCSLGNNDPSNKLTVTCKTWEDKYKKHFLWLSDNVTYFVEQLESKDVSAYHYKVVFKPSLIIPDIDIR